MPNNDVVQPLRSGGRTFGDDDSVSYRWALYDRAAVEESLQACLVDDPGSEAQADLANTLMGWYYFDGGAGQVFGNAPSVRLTRTKILVTQRVGRDI